MLEFKKKKKKKQLRTYATVWMVHGYNEKPYFSQPRDLTDKENMWLSGLQTVQMHPLPKYIVKRRIREQWASTV